MSRRPSYHQLLRRAEVARGTGDELPGAGRVGARVGEGVVGTLDDRQQRQLGRHAAFDDSLEYVLIVALRAVRYAVEIVLVFTVILDLLVDPAVILCQIELEVFPAQRPEIVRDLGGARDHGGDALAFVPVLQNILAVGRVANDFAAGSWLGVSVLQPDRIRPAAATEIQLRVRVIVQGSDSLKNFPHCMYGS